MAGDMEIILGVYLKCLLLGLLFWPLVAGVFGGLKDGGYILGKLASGLLTALLVWMGGHIWNVNNAMGVSVAILVLGSLSMMSLRQRFWRGKLTFVVIEEILFGLGLWGLSVVRGFNPDILDLEKFMDFGFVNSYLHSPGLPAPDMWFAGESINYYSFGQFWTSVMIRIWGVIPTVGYNLMLGFLLGLGLALTFCLITNIKEVAGKRIKLIWGGVVGALLVNLGGNSQMAWYLFKNKSLENYWYPDATRFIDKTIHEFPGYSFVVSDLHAHLLDLPMVLAFLITWILWMTKPRRYLAIVMGGLIGVMAMTNTWDVLIYGLLAIIGVGYVLFKKEIAPTELVRMVLLGLPVMVAVVLPWAINFKQISSGVGIVIERTPLWQLGVLWGGHLTLLTLAVMSAKKERRVVFCLSFLAVILLIIPELVFVRDIYTTYPRANTMFKLTYQSFVLMGILGGYVVSRMRILTAVPIYALCGLLITYPAIAFPTFNKSFRNYQGLDGRSWFAGEMPFESRVADYLSEQVDGKNMVEAVGDSYTKYNAVSVFSGKPTVVGWRVHEWLWRGGYDIVTKRRDEVLSIYSSRNADEVKGLLAKYNVGWILISDHERVSYNVNTALLKTLGEVVISERENLLIRVE